MPNLLKAMTFASPLIIKPTTNQTSGFLGILLTIIGFSLLLKALTGNGILVCSRYQPLPPLPPPKSDGNGMQVTK